LHFIVEYQVMQTFSSNLNKNHDCPPEKCRGPVLWYGSITFQEELANTDNRKPGLVPERL
jgi:hypothetical protein